jgi:hypothetical protein
VARLPCAIDVRRAVRRSSDGHDGQQLVASNERSLGSTGDPLAMARDILFLTAGALVVAAAAWSIWGNAPLNARRPLPIEQRTDHNPDLNFVTQRSPYMRDER